MSITSFVKRIQDITRNDAGVNGDAQRIEQMSWLLFLKIYDSREMVWELEEDEYESIIPEELKWRNWAHAQNGERVLTGDELLDFVNNKLFKELKELEITSIMPIRKTIVKSAFEDANNYMKNGSCYAKSSMLLMKLISIALKIVIRLMIFTKKFLKIFKMLGTQENFIRHVQRLILLPKFLTQNLENQWQTLLAEQEAS